jgi:hypothetical protein
MTTFLTQAGSCELGNGVFRLYKIREISCVAKQLLASQGFREVTYCYAGGGATSDIRSFRAW